VWCLGTVYRLLLLPSAPLLTTIQKGPHRDKIRNDIMVIGSWLFWPLLAEVLGGLGRFVSRSVRPHVIHVKREFRSRDPLSRDEV